MIDAIHLRLNVIRPVLKYLEPEIPYSMAAENLLMGTCAQESAMGKFLVQNNNGPARGIFQMEDATHDDINDETDAFDNYLLYRHKLDDKIDFLRIYPKPSPDDPLKMGTDDYDSINLTANLVYAAAMCRVHYYRVPKPMPAAHDLQGLAEYWKAYYNTPLGAGKVEEFVANYKVLVV